MKILVTGSAGHLGEALMRTLQAQGHEALGLDLLASPFTHVTGSIADAGVVNHCMNGVQAVLHTATLHKPHVATHSRQAFVDTNITGTLNLLEAAAAHRVGAFVFTSTTSVFGRALRPAPEAPAAWITEEATPLPKNIYGVTKLAAENLCELFALKQRLPCTVLRTSRFFPEADDSPATRAAFDDDNTKANELLYRRADVEDIVSAHLLAMSQLLALRFEARQAPPFARYIISATSPFTQADLAELRRAAPQVLARYFPGFTDDYARRGWKMFDSIDRVYVNALARAQLGWQPRYDFAHVLACMHAGTDFRSPLTHQIGSKGYHDEVFEDGPFPVDR